MVSLSFRSLPVAVYSPSGSGLCPPHPVPLPPKPFLLQTQWSLWVSQTCLTSYLGALVPVILSSWNVLLHDHMIGSFLPFRLEIKRCNFQVTWHEIPTHTISISHLELRTLPRDRAQGVSLMNELSHPPIHKTTWAVLLFCPTHITHALIMQSFEAIQLFLHTRLPTKFSAACRKEPCLHGFPVPTSTHF